MKIHVISTINGQENEGMRNIATHLTREWEKSCKVRYSGLKDFFRVIKNTVSCDVTVLFARAGKAAYYLLRLLCLLSKNVWMVCVQEPDENYKALCKKKAPAINYFTLIPEDLENVNKKESSKVLLIRVGINDKKFAPVTLNEAATIKRVYGFSEDKKLVVHVGHCSQGRGLEQFAALTDNEIEKLAVVSGMFEDEQTKNMLQQAGVKILTGYLPYVEEIYQMADVYLFPTKSAEYVISIPLSVMEALACGTPVAAFGDLPGIEHIQAVDNAVKIVSEEVDLNSEIRTLSKIKSDKTLLSDPISWDISADEALSAIKENLK